MVKVGDVVSVRETSKNNPTILAARDATAHAPAPNWIEVDREASEGRVTALPKRERAGADPVERAAHRRAVLEVSRTVDGAPRRGFKRGFYV